MKVEFDLSLASDLAQLYEETETAIQEQRTEICNVYQELVGSRWSGEAQESFSLRYEQWDAVLEMFIQRLTQTGQILQQYTSGADELRQESERLVQYLD